MINQQFNTTGEEQYLRLLEHILDNGYKVDKERTGTGTIVSPTPHQLHFPNVAEKFPLFTTKYVSFNMLACEMLWFISGGTNANRIQDIGSRSMAMMWLKWADDDGELGPVYGFNWRNFGKTPNSIPQPEPKLPKNIKATYLRVANGEGKEGHPLAKTWEGMIARCYDPNSNSYHLYGEKGVHVSNRWLEFRNFVVDAVNLEGYDKKLESDTRYVLDKDTKGIGFKYSRDTCCWITDQENALGKSEKLYIVRKDNEIYKFTNPTQFCREQGIPNNNFSDLWTGRKNAQRRHGFELVEVIDLNSGIDQLKEVINSIKNNPTSRRHIVTAWNPQLIPYQKLPPCHLMYQFTCEPLDWSRREKVNWLNENQFYQISNFEFNSEKVDKMIEEEVPKYKLHLHLTQRSCDMFLGVPFNVAEYALLLLMIAQVTNTVPGNFTWTGINCHIYQNHIDAVKKQVYREPYNPSKVEIADMNSIDDYTIEDLLLLDYKHHPAIKAEVSV